MFQELVHKEDAAANLVQIAGLVRFSYPCHGGFQTAPTNIYAQSRMQERFRYFEALCLHSLCTQSDKNFTIGVLIGADMPTRFKAKLEQLLARLPQARLIELPPLPYAEAMRLAFAQLFDGDAPYNLSFRLDDDDAMAGDFIENVRAKLPQLFALSGGLDPVGLSFLKGITLLGAKGHRRMIMSVDARPLGVGLCVMVPRSRTLNALAFRHQNIQMHMPVIKDPFPLMNLRSFHSSNDSKARRPAGYRVALDNQSLHTAIKTRFSLDMDKVLSL